MPALGAKVAIVTALEQYHVVARVVDDVDKGPVYDEFLLLISAPN